MRRIWTNEEIEILKNMYPDAYSVDVANKLNMSVDMVYRKAYALGIKKSEAFKMHELQKVQGDRLRKMGANSRFGKGHIPANKGVKMSEDVYKKVQATMFKKGQIPATAKPDGYERLRKDKKGRYYWMIKVAGIRKMVYKHIYLYCMHYGVTLEKGQNIIFKDGNTDNVDIDNLECVTDYELMLRNTIQRYPDDIKQTIRLLSKLKKKIHAKEQNSRS